MPFEPSGEEKTFCPYYVKIQHPLSFLERCIYYVVHFITVLYLLYATYNSSQEYKDHLDLSEGDYFGVKKDNGDHEWSFWKEQLYRLRLFYVLYAVLSVLIQRLKNPTLYWLFMIAYTTVVWTYLIGIMAISVVYIQIGISIFTSLLTGSKIMVWIVNVFSTILLHKSYAYNWSLYFSSSDFGSDMMLYTLSVNNLRCISVGIDLLSIELPSLGETLLRGYGYCCYFPLFSTGPHVSFLNFVHDICKPFKPATINEILCHIYCILRLVFYFYILEFALHHMYIHSIISDLNILSKLPLSSIVGIGYAAGYFFHIKYIGLYGFPKVCSWYDGVNVPRTPSCYMHAYKFSDVWRYFDKGLYEFIKRYIFVPLGGSRCGIRRQLLSSAASFYYIYLWHGTHTFVLLWSTVNFLVVSVEVCFLRISQTRLAANLKKNYLGPAWSRRIQLMSFCPILYASHAAIICFFAEQDIAVEYLSRVHASFANLFMFFFCFYCAIATAFDINHSFPKSLE